MRLGGRTTLVRESDGIHLNEKGAGFLADLLVARLRQEFVVGS